MHRSALVCAVALIALGAGVASATSIAGCTFKVGSATIDLSPLNQATPYNGTDGTYNYLFQVCGTVPTSLSGKCNPTSTSASMVQFFGTACTAFESAWAPETVDWKLIDTSNPKGGIYYTATNGAECDKDGDKLPRVVHWQFLCDEGGPDYGGFEVALNEVNSSSCETKFQIKSGLACPGASSSGPDDDDDDDDDDDGSHKSGGGGGLSGGWVFTIIVIVTSVVYCAAGAVWQHRKGATGAELCPNLEFWRGIPGLVKDGCSFTAEKLRSLCGGGGGGGSENYDSM